MKESIILLTLVCMLGLTHPLQSMNMPTLSDNLVALRANLDDVKKAQIMLKQNLEALQTALKKPSGAGSAASGPGGGGPGGSGGMPGSMVITPFESLPQELKKLIAEIVLSDITFDLTYPKGLYDSIKAAGRKIANIRLLDKYYAKSYQMPVVVGIICHYLQNQLIDEDAEDKENITCNFWNQVLSTAISNDNFVICKIILTVANKDCIKELTSRGIERITNLNHDRYKVLIKDDATRLKSFFEAADANAITDCLKTFYDHEGFTILLRAVLKNDTDMVQLILQALGDEAPEVIKMRFEGSVNLQDKLLINFLSPNSLGLEQQRLFPDYYLAGTTMRYNAKPIGGKLNGLTALHGAILMKNLTMVQAILKSLRATEEQAYQFINQSMEMETDSTPFLIAINKGSAAIAFALIKAVGGHAKELIKLQSEDGQTILHLATLRDTQLMQYLLNINNNYDFLSIQDRRGLTALAYAVNYMQPEIVKLLIPEVDPSKNISKFQMQQQLVMKQDNNGNTLLHYDNSFAKPEIVNLILNAAGGKRKSLVMQKDLKGNTCLHTMALRYDKKYTKKEAVEAVLKAAGDKAKELILMKNKDDETALKLLGGQAPEIKNLLKSYVKK